METIRKHGGITFSSEFPNDYQFTRTVEKEQFKRRERTAEDEEIDHCSFEHLDLMFKTVNSFFFFSPTYSQLLKSLILTFSLSEKPRNLDSARNPKRNLPCPQTRTSSFFNSFSYK